MLEGMHGHFQGGSRICHGGTKAKGVRQPIIWPNVSEYCMKMKKIGRVYCVDQLIRY